MTINIAIIGVGWAGTRHIEAINELNASTDKPVLDVAMIVDPDADHMTAVAGRFGVGKTATSLEDALAIPEIDAVSIATPHPHHVDAAILAAQAGKHIAVEKPMAVTVDEADRMIAAAEEAGVKLFVTEQVAYSAEVARLRDLLTTGERIGEPTFASVVAGFRADEYGYPGRRAWLAEPQHGGSGTWLLHGVHTVAAVRAIFGEARRVYCVESSTPSFGRNDIEGTMSCLLEMESGLTVQLTQTCETDFGRDRSGTTIFGTQGTVFAGRDGISVHSKRLETPLKIELDPVELADYALEFKAFAEWLDSDVEPPTTGRSERGSLAIVQAGYESAESGEPIELAKRFG